jgi:hypothetical protein
MVPFPFEPVVTLVPIPAKTHREWWARERRSTPLPLNVILKGAQASIHREGASDYRLTPNDGGGFSCSRLKSAVTLGEVYTYGVRHALTTAFFQELSAVRAAVFGTGCPSPLCYEMPNGDLVHPGPCFTNHPGSLIKRTRYNLTEDASVVCSVCKERFV